MNKYFEYNEWGNIFEENPRPFFNNQDINYSDDTAFHGDGCKCDQEVGFKVQYLRFIYSFCCRDNDNIENKINLLSKSDLEETFAKSYFYYFYLYMNLNKYNLSDIEGNKFGYFCDKLFVIEKSSAILFSGFFDYLTFIKLMGKANINKNKKTDLKETPYKLNEIEKEICIEDLIMSNENVTFNDIKEESKYDNIERNIVLSNSTKKIDEVKIQTFKTTKISKNKNHFNKGAPGNNTLFSVKINFKIL